mgnify:CR=1 FL=1
MEPVLSKVPVCFGPYVANVAEAAAALRTSGGAVCLEQASQIGSVFHGWLLEKASREAGEKAWVAVASMRGATERTLSQVLSHIPGG